MKLIKKNMSHSLSAYQQNQLMYFTSFSRTCSDPEMCNNVFQHHNHHHHNHNHHVHGKAEMSSEHESDESIGHDTSMMSLPLHNSVSPQRVFIRYVVLFKVLNAHLIIIISSSNTEIIHQLISGSLPNVDSLTK